MATEATRHPWRTRAGILAVVVVLSVGGVRWMSLRRAAWVQAGIKNGPLTISAKEVGMFAKGFSWSLNVAPTGKAVLEVDAVTEKTRQFMISQAQLDELREALLRERFFELGDSYGQLVADGSTTTLRISAGDVSKTVELRFLMNWVNDEPEKLREPSRAVRVLQIIRGWFDDPEAVDLREYDRIVLDAAKRVE
jgi:hypothetical protein